jgi:hypothetical protein
MTRAHDLTITVHVGGTRSNTRARYTLALAAASALALAPPTVGAAHGEPMRIQTNAAEPPFFGRDRRKAQWKDETRGRPRK